MLCGRAVRAVVCALAFLVMMTFILVGCGRNEPRTGSERFTTSSLPPPMASGGMPLNDALARRRSVRSFGPGKLSTQEISDLLWAAQGITEPDRGYRTAPSAGALYPLELYVLVDGSLGRYRPEDHTLEALASGISSEDLATAAGQSFVGEAPAVFVITCDLSRIEPKYGSRAARYSYMEAGHAAQNLVLEATSLGLASVTVGAFDDERTRDLLNIPSSEQPLYLIPVGRMK